MLPHRRCGSYPDFKATNYNYNSKVVLTDDGAPQSDDDDEMDDEVVEVNEEIDSVSEGGQGDSCRRGLLLMLLLLFIDGHSYDYHSIQSSQHHTLLAAVIRLVTNICKSGNFFLLVEPLPLLNTTHNNPYISYPACSRNSPG